MDSIIFLFIKIKIALHLNTASSLQSCTFSQFILCFRLIKGDGEVLEEIVSRDRHKEINRQATNADGAFFQSQTVDRKYL